MTDTRVEHFEALILPHLDAAYTFAWHLLRDEHDAQDAVQEAALRAFRAFASFRGGDPRSWFLAIVRNVCFASRRRHRAEPMASLRTDDHLSIAVEPRSTDAAAIQDSEAAAIRRAIAALPVEFREVIVLRELHGLSYTEIGRVLGIPIGTVMSRLSRARRGLAERLGFSAREVS